MIDALLPDMEIEDTVRTTVTGVDFSQALLEGMLGLLLFAGALHVKLSDLQKQWSLILLMATLGVALSTLVFGVGATSDVWPAPFSCAGLWLSHLAN